MLGNGRRSALHLKKPPDRHFWICKRCFHARNPLYADQQPEHKPELSKSSADKPISPIEAFRQRFAQQQQSTNEPPKRPHSPADIFRTNWMNVPPSEKPAPNTEEPLSFDNLLKGYRQSGVKDDIKSARKRS